MCCCVQAKWIHSVALGSFHPNWHDATPIIGAVLFGAASAAGGECASGARS
jgi:hypothetical protein